MGGPGEGAKGGVMLMRVGRIGDRELAQAEAEYRRQLAALSSVAPLSWQATVMRTALDEVIEARARLRGHRDSIGTLGDRVRWKGRAA
jgi:hypothetical protein